MFKRKPQEASIPSKITSRVSRLGTGALGEYVETYISDVGKYTRLYTTSGQDAYLEEALTAAQVVLALVTEMKNRGS